MGVSFGHPGSDGFSLQVFLCIFSPLSIPGLRSRWPAPQSPHNHNAPLAINHQQPKPPSPSVTINTSTAVGIDHRHYKPHSPYPSAATFALPPASSAASETTATVIVINQQRHEHQLSGRQESRGDRLQGSGNYAPPISRLLRPRAELC